MVGSARVWRCLENRTYDYCDVGNIIWFRSRHDNMLGFLNVEERRIYWNMKYKNNFRRATGEIRKDYCSMIDVYDYYISVF